MQAIITLWSTNGKTGEQIPAPKLDSDRDGVVDAERIDCRVLPRIDGTGLTLDEWFELSGVINEARYRVMRLDDGSFLAADKAALAAAKEALPRILAKRPHAAPLKARRTPVKPIRHTLADELWWASNSPLNTMQTLPPICGGEPDPHGDMPAHRRGTPRGRFHREDPRPYDRYRDGDDAITGSLVGHPAQEF